MSANNLSSAFWWTTQESQQYSIMESSSKKGFNFNLNDDEDPQEQLTEERPADYDGDQVIIVPKDHLFEKSLTPSDVGKLNRLVIPKQNAEKYFPLTGQDSTAAAAGEKGLLLTFEDESGKLWRFRYSYWNSSQSYVLTKGWSRFVKEKQLSAGDVVVFQRHRLESDRFFIGWRKKNAAGASAAASAVNDEGVSQPCTVVGGGWGQVYYPYLPAAELPYQQPDCLHTGSSIGRSQTRSSGNSRTLRLFGVNMECQRSYDNTGEAEPPATPDGSTTTSQPQAGHHYLYKYYSNPHASYANHYPRTEQQQNVNFSRDVNQMRYQQG